MSAPSAFTPMPTSVINMHFYPGASMGDGYGPMLVAKNVMSSNEIAKATIAVPGEMTSAFLALQLWLDTPATKLNYKVVPFDKIFETVNKGEADVGLIIHEGN